MGARATGQVAGVALAVALLATGCSPAVGSGSESPSPTAPVDGAEGTETARPSATPAPTTTSGAPADSTLSITAAGDLPTRPDGPPSVALVGTTDGVLSLWDTASARSLREIHIFSDPRDFGEDGEPFAAGAFLDDAILVEDIAVVAVCCEPAVGALRTYALDAVGDAAGETVAYGDDPAVSYDGKIAAAFATGDFIAIHPTVPRDLESRGRLIDLTQLGESGTGTFTTAMDLAWAPDGRHLAAMVAIDDTAAELWVLDADAERVAARLTPPGDRTWSSPVFLRDGSIVVAEHPRGDDAAPTTLLVLGLEDGARRATVELEMSAARIRIDASHSYLLITGNDGSLSWRDGVGGADTVIVRAGVLDADWR